MRNIKKILIIIILFFCVAVYGQHPIDSTKYYKSKYDSAKSALIRANLKIIRVQYYLKITNKNPKKFNGFLRGWLNGLFENQ